MRQLPILALSLILLACGSSKETGSTRKTTGSTDDLRKYEADFRPSDLDPDASAATVKTPPDTAIPMEHTSDVPAQTTLELVPGFRVQVLSTTTIDELLAKKQAVEALFPTEWFYLEYDPPTYKIRAGNFLTRFEADRFAKQLSEKGYPDAWAVPTRVFKQPPPVVHETPTTPK
jgi:hypothetical protein